MILIGVGQGGIKTAISPLLGMTGMGRCSLAVAYRSQVTSIHREVRRSKWIEKARKWS